MKEIAAIIRMNKIGDTKQALMEAGYPAFTCRKVFGRGKQKVDYEIIENLIEGSMAPNVAEPEVMESITENYRLIAKRMFFLVVDDEDVDKVVDIIIKENKTGNMGDGKIFISNIEEAVRIRTDEKDHAAIV
ncbi:nitrogen regulatory protein P-II family [Dethiosulfatibacter aminovorans DSM 17477]|uniref:Nitrogen regulatory protein P-II family n=1 Tax=Dethiosulfatibacter aminovorans DSM 17477 TaxID=1121476 RepID=A0A1M6CCI3_9FIRM|nr:P-II family nitrogen regulator [Dethiosulfatibacter aminovorans]SHI58719.1 nitrogen regulatory protein P-II family [Dethiosulfatibacter aminovorans DSM 17477]